MNDGIRHDLHQRDATAIEIDEREPAAARRVLVQQARRVLLEVRARDANLDRSL